MLVPIETCLEWNDVAGMERSSIFDRKTDGLRRY